MRTHTPENHPTAIGYSHAVETSARLLFISGQTPKRPDGGPVAEDPVDQVRQTLANLKNVLETAGAGIENLVSVRCFLASRRYRDALRTARTEAFGDHLPALTVVICGIWDEDWVCEIEAVAELPA
jgi:enamine deaminase RidA (YjgF/YER057c/UK114 family)